MEREYEIGVWYKLETFDKLFFTACIISETDLNIKFDTVRNEQLIWAKRDIKRATKLERNGSDF
ncbi:MAG: hypothetical protein WCI04_05125 [archaeon]